MLPILELQGKFKARQSNMRIDLNSPPQPSHDSNRSRTSSASNDGPSASHRLAGEDQAQLSGIHARGQALAAQISQLPEVRQEWVEALRQAIQNGQYQTSPEKVAGALFDHMIAGSAA
jgi:flagellar biosynthesis anti-sigma factor FlgM